MKIIYFLLPLFVSQGAWATTIFEPSVSLGSGGGSITTTNATTSTNTNASVQTFTGAVGFKYGIAREYMHVTGILEGHFVGGTEGNASSTTGSTTTSVASATQSNFLGFGGFGFGYEWNIPLRTYFIVGAFDFDTDFLSGGVELSYYISDSTWLGLRFINQKSQIVQRIGTTDTQAEMSLNRVSLTLSFPIEFSYPNHWFRKKDWE